MFNNQSFRKNNYQLNGSFARRGYDWWWHSLTAFDSETHEKKQFFFEFFIINPKKSKEKATFGKLGETPSYLMVKAGCWGKDHMQLHRFFSLQDVDIRTKPSIQIEAKDCYLDEFSSHGMIDIPQKENAKHPEWMCDFGTLSWNLKIEKKIAFDVGYGTSSLFRFLKAFEMYWHVQGMKTLYEGEIICNGRKYIVEKDTCNGYADKNWGKDFTSPWIWLSSNHIFRRETNEKLDNTVFDIGGGRPKVFFVPLERKLLGALYLEGKEYEFNFSKFWTGAKTQFDCRITDTEVIWHIVLENHKYRLVTDVTCEKEDMLLVNYEAPDGIQRHNNLYNGGNGFGYMKLYQKKHKEDKLIEDLVVFDIGCEYGEYDKKFLK